MVVDLDGQEDLPPGIGPGDFVPLSIEEFQCGLVTMLCTLAGLMPEAPGFRAVGDPVHDTRYMRALHSASVLFAGSKPKLASFRWRVNAVYALTLDRRYLKYRLDGGLAMHVALLGAIVTARGSARTTKEALRVEFEAEFLRQLARVPEPDDVQSLQ